MARARTSFRRTLADFPPPTPQDTPCRLWQGPTNGKAGYGSRPDRQLIHRWVWEQINGPIPEGMRVLHRCDQPLCYRYSHLFLGTGGDNSVDMVTKGRHRGGTAGGEAGPGAKLTWEQVRAIRAQPERSRNELAAEYGVSVNAIYRIRKGLTWVDFQAVEE